MGELVLPVHVVGLACVECGEVYDDPWQWQCPACGPESRVDVVYDEDAIRGMGAKLAGRAPGMWRYVEALPIPVGAALPPVLVGDSPVSEAPRLAEALGVARVVIKDDGRNPSASLKDRASAVGVVLAIEAGLGRIACASTGNAASSTACIAASMGLDATIFVPKRAPAPKVAQLRIFGAQVFRVDADYDRTWELCAEVAERWPWFNRNCAVNPYLMEGKKTAALELAEQLGDKMPAWVSVSVGDGCTIAGIVKGLEQAHTAGLIPFVPRVLGVQAEGAQPLVKAFNEGRDLVLEAAETVADSICVAHPRNWRKALQAVGRVDGAYVAVSDAAILDAMTLGGQLAGVFGEPAAAAATAGVKVAVARGIIKPNEDVAVLITGNGLKDTATALKAVSGPVDVAASVAAVEAHLNR